MSKEEVEASIADFEAICRQLEVRFGLTHEEEPSLSGVPAIDGLLSFETKVKHLSEFFDSRANELANAIITRL